MAINCGCFFFFVGTIFISTYVCAVFAEDKNEDLTHFENNSLEITMMQSKDEKFLIYRNALKQECYVEQLIIKLSSEEQKSRTLYVNSAKITESNPVYRQLDAETLEFCKNFSILILKEQPPFYTNGENHSRKRRQIETNKKSFYRGQTQTQFISFDSEKDNGNIGGISEAVAELDKSRATVNGRSGMGQAQSQSNNGNCDGCSPQTLLETQEHVGSKTQQTNNQQAPDAPSYTRGQPVFPTILGQPPQTDSKSGMATSGLQGIFPDSSTIPNSSSQTGRPGQTVNVSGQNGIPQIASSQPTVTPLQNQTPGQATGGQNMAQIPGQYIPQQFSPGYQVQSSQYQPNTPGQILPYQPFLTNHQGVGSINQGYQPNVRYPQVGMMPPVSDPQQNTQSFQPSGVQQLPINANSPNFFSGTNAYPTFLGYPQQSTSLGSSNQPYPADTLNIQYPPLFYGAQNGFTVANYPGLDKYNSPTGTHLKQYPSNNNQNQRFPNVQFEVQTPNYPAQTGFLPQTSPENAGINYPPGNINQNYPIQVVYKPQELPSSTQPGVPNINYPTQTVYLQGMPSGIQPGTSNVNYPTQIGYVPQGTWSGVQLGLPGSNSLLQTGFTPQGTPLGTHSGSSVNYPLQTGYTPQSTSVGTRVGASNMNYPTYVRYVPILQGISSTTQHGTPMQSGLTSNGKLPGAQTDTMNVNYPTLLGSGIQPGASNVNYPVHTGFTSGGVYPGAQTGSQQIYYPTQMGYIPQGTLVTVQPEMRQIPQGVSSGMQNVNYLTPAGQSGAGQNTYPAQIGDSSQSAIPSSLGQSGATHVGPGPVTSTVGFPAVNPTQNNYQSPTRQVGNSLNQLNQTEPQVSPADTESGETQSLSSLHIRNNETKAEASAQGKTKTGLAQAQVSGTYTGSFSAQAQTGDNEKNVQTQIFGNNTGATSSSQGRAGKVQSQSQILYSRETGASLAETQGTGVNYVLNSQIQAGKLGGKADAQSSGTGSTSSQAQIGFGPPDKNFKQQSMFEGGGTSSSQSGVQSGQVQTVYQGSFRFGPSFTGAAQSSAGKSTQNTTRLAFNLTNLSGLGKNVDSGIDRRRDNLTLTENLTSYVAKPENDVIKSTLPLELVNNSADSINEVENRTHSHNFEGTSNDDDEDEESGEMREKQIHSNKKDNEEPSQTQDAYINSKVHDAYIHRESSYGRKEPKIFNSGDVIPGTNHYKVPIGFRGRVMSTAGDKTEAVAAPGGQAQTQTVLLKPGSGRVTVVDQSRPRQYLQNDSDGAEEPKNGYDSYVTVTNTETGELNQGHRKYAHTYYTKSSACGYFTFTCSLVDGTNGQTKICTPGPPTYADGTPC